MTRSTELKSYRLKLASAASMNALLATLFWFECRRAEALALAKAATEAGDAG